MRKKILNVKTGRFVYETGKIGKQILNECSAKNRVLSCTFVRTLVKRFLVYQFIGDYHDRVTKEFDHLCNTSKRLNLFYRKALFYIHLQRTISFNEIQYFYLCFIKKNIRWNLYNNADELISNNITFCKKVKKILKERKVHCRLPTFKKYILSLSNSIVHESNTHRLKLQKYMNSCLFSRTIDITVFW